MHTSGGAPVVEGNIIACNFGGYGSALITNHTNLSFRNNIVFNNIAEPFEVGAAYGATILIFGGTAEIEHNTIAGNISRGNSLPGSGRGAGMLLWNSSGTIRSNIIWHNEQSLGGQVFLINSPGVLLSQNNIEGNTWPGNINGDPLLTPGSLTLAPGSPSLYPDGRQQGAYGGGGPGLLPVLAQAGAYLFRRQYEASVSEDGQARLSLNVLNTGTASLEVTSVESTGGSLATFAAPPTIPFLDSGALTLVIEPMGGSDTLLMFHNACHPENPLPIVVDYQYPSQAGEAPQPAFSIFPNPANDQLSVEMPVPGQYDLHLLDATGQSILKKEAGATADAAQLAIGNLPRGLYVLLIFENGVLKAAEQLVK
ncbi:MAG: T9SS type A sorting domain-containing protein [Phaeodactylibacter sp.]|nr:T9SS type A sorting domain-containing protein [Phaeodactylibacter sp.]